MGTDDTIELMTAEELNGRPITNEIVREAMEKKVRELKAAGDTTWWADAIAFYLAADIDMLRGGE